VIAEAQRLKEERRKAKREEFLAAIRRKADEYGVDIDEVVRALQKKERRAPAADRRATVAPKYRNPQNPSETWSGRGVKPKWMQALLANGAKPEQFLIEPSAAGESRPSSEGLTGRF
jgi:DNA-binding protein H-NS